LGESVSTKKTPLRIGQHGTVVNLASKDGSLYKKTLLCRTGEFMASTGPVTVDRALLQLLADTYNSARANPQNENDFAPLILDHERKVDNTKGRLMAGLEVAPWVNPETGEELDGLYGDLRVDDEIAKTKVDSGLYSQVSLSFDEETGEIFECSFVAVEAARRSQVLSQGEMKNMNFELQNKKLKTNLAKAKSKTKELKAVSFVAAETANKQVEAATADLAKMITEVEGAKTALKTAMLSSQFKSFIRQGKMNLAEMKTIKVADLAQLPDASIKHILGSYSARPVSPNVVQHGQTGATPMALAKVTSAQIRELATAQKAGKSVKSLATADESDEEKKKREDSEKLAAEHIDNPTKSPEKEFGLEDVESVSRHLQNTHESLGKVSEGMKGMGEMLKKLMESNSDKDDDNKDDDSEENE